MQISNEMTALIRDVFPSAEAEPILSSLSSLEEDDSPEPDQIIGAILILLKRHGPAQLDAVVRLAARDWRDLLMAAGLADDDWAFRLRTAIVSWGGNPGTLMTKRSWPQRSNVSVRTNGGDVLPYSVVTWLSREKAVAIAVMAHIHRHAPGTGAMAIHDVEIVDAGPVGRDSNGLMSLAGKDLTDRMEF